MSNYRVTFTRLHLLDTLCDYGEFDAARKLKSATDDEIRHISCLAGNALLSGEFGRLIDASIAAGGVEFAEGMRRPLKRKRAKRLVTGKEAYAGHPLPEFLGGRDDRFPIEIGERILELYAIDPIILRTEIHSDEYTNWELGLDIKKGCERLDTLMAIARSKNPTGHRQDLCADRDPRRFA